MIGNLTLTKFAYAFLDGKVQESPDQRPVAAKMLHLVDAEGCEISVVFQGAEQWVEFQRQVAESKPPTDVVVVPGGALRHMNGHG